MAVVYATLIVKGKKSFSEVPDRIKDQVKAVLADLDCPELAESGHRVRKSMNDTINPLYGLI